MTETQSTDPLKVVGRYALYREIAAGGMATVHFGRLLGPVGFARTVAIKRLHPQYARDPEFVSMFLDEARLAARIRHPNVVPTIDVVAANGELFLVMEYVQGESLARLMRASHEAGELVPPRIVAGILTGVLHGLHAAHEARSERGEPLNIVHRDISPQNVLVGADGISRVLDFGVAKAAGRLQATRDGELKGKLTYMAPEQFSGVVMRQTDIYALGVVLWESLASRRLFAGATEAETVRKILAGEVPKLTSLIPSIHPAYDDVLARALAPNPEDRYATARDMANALEACAGLASPSEVGSWVERLAGATLLMRGETLCEIESTSSGIASPRHLRAVIEEARKGPSTPAATEPTISLKRASKPEFSDDLSSISVAHHAEWMRKQPDRSRTRLVAAAVGAAVLVLGIALLGSRTNHASIAASRLRVAAVAPAEPLPSAPVTVRTEDTSTAEPTTNHGAGTSDAGAARTVQPRKETQPARAPTRPAPAPPPRPTVKPDCETPYVIDEAGRKKWKLECL